MHLRRIALLTAGLWLAVPAMAYAASTSAVAAQQQLPQEQRQARATQLAMSQLKGQAHAVQQQFAQGQQALGHIQQTLAPPTENTASGQPVQALARAKAHAVVLNHAAVALQTLTVQSAQQIQTVRTAADRAAALAEQTRRQETQTVAQTASVRALLNGQLQFIEEHGTVGYLSVLFGARSFSDFVSRVELLSEVLGQTSQLQGQLQTQSLRQQHEARQLAQEQALIQQMQQTLSQHQVLLAQEKALLQHAIQAAALQVQSAQIQAAIAQYGQTPASRPALYQALYPLIAPLAKQDGVAPALILAVITEESGGNTHAVSNAGAIGLMQLEPGTAQMLGMSPSELTNPQVNVVAGCLYLHDLLAQFHGNVSLALSGYNAGPGAVTANHGKVVACTTGYVRNVEAMAQQYAVMVKP